MSPVSGAPWRLVGLVQKSHPQAEDLYAKYLKEREAEEEPMTEFPKWSDIHAGIVANSGGEATVADARRRNQAYVDGY